VLKQILDMAGLADQPMSLQRSEITCNGDDGRISCTPLEILVADAKMTLTGSVGFDGSVDYLLEIPVTRNLVGREGYRFLQGTTIKVPIRGNGHQLDYDRSLLSDALAGLMTQAAENTAGRVIRQQADKILPGLLDGFNDH